MFLWLLIWVVVTAALWEQLEGPQPSHRWKKRGWFRWRRYVCEECGLVYPEGSGKRCERGGR